MQFSQQWLQQWVALELPVEGLAQRLTAAGLEVDGIHPVASQFSGVVVGEILDCEPHPDADKLKLCTVSDGESDDIQVVCGAPNAAPGLKMPFARVGARLSSAEGETFKIRKAKLRGIESFGMCCSARELGLSEDHDGLMALPADASVGEDFRAWLGLEDHSIDLDLTPNRADCLGIKGLARDVAAVCEANYTPLEIAPIAAQSDEQINITLSAPEDCPRYVGRIIRDIDPTAPSPLWMREALRRSGIRSISAVVDATNYVLMELGQPMHAFDLGKLSGPAIEVRRGRKGEKLTLLDGKEVDIDDSLLTICDANKPVALAGIMGGLDSGVSDSTTDILLESAWFKPSTIMGKARDLGLHTDASHRFERGVDPSGQLEAIERISALLLATVGGKAGPLITAESEPHLPQSKAVPLRLARINRVLGSNLSADLVQGVLERLGMSLKVTDEGWLVSAPAARFDIDIEEDLIEEVARVYGYDRLPAALPSGAFKLKAPSETQVPLTQIREAMCAAGYQEVITYAFVDQQLLSRLHMDKDVLPLANPISSDMDVMRTALLPGLLTAMARNQRRQHERIRLFETGKVFIQQSELHEIERLGAVICGQALPEQWGSKKRGVDFYDLKGDLENMLALRGLTGELEFVQISEAFLHPGQAATVALAGREIGWLGAVHPAVVKAMELRGPVFAFEVDLKPLVKRDIPIANKISPFPSVRRDLAFLVPEKVNYNEIRVIINKLAGDLLSKLVIFDQFEGESVETGYKSLAIGLILQDVSCTLTDVVVDSLIDRVVDAMGSQLQAQLRG